MTSEQFPDQFEVDCCPNCESTRYSVRSGTRHVGEAQRNPDDPDAKYWCRDCRTGFDALATKRTHTTGTNSALGAKLAKLDADEVLDNARAGLDGGDA